MFSVHAYAATVASSTSATYGQIAPVADPILTVSGNYFYIGALQNLIGGILLSPTGDKTKITTPSILSIFPYQINAVVKSALPTQYMNTDLQPESPVSLVQNEGMDFNTSNSSNSATTAALGLVFLSDGALAPSTGKILTARATVPTGSTANVWANGALTFDTNLPAGNYNLVGARVEGAHCKCFRVVFQGNAGVRPGGIAALGQDGADIWHQRKGRLGTWGTFSNFNPPSLDTISDGTNETAVVYLDLIKA